MSFGRDWARHWTEALRLFEAEGSDQMSAEVLRLRRLDAREALAAYETTDGVEISSCDCDPCSTDVARRAVADELAAPRIPHAGCLDGWCSCVYMPVIDIPD